MPIGGEIVIPWPPGGLGGQLVGGPPLSVAKQQDYWRAMRTINCTISREGTGAGKCFVRRVTHGGFILRRVK